ncbi:MAG: biotin transporter BioY [Desulfobacterales bacterium]|nr:biotin transporter BioY [Desulfobacterales bacterium]
MPPSTSIRMTVYASLMAALIAAGAFIAIPIGPVPIVLQNFFVFLAGLLLGKRWGLAAVGVYLLAGACGLPVFAGGTGGLGRFVGPTGGYLLAYLPVVYIIGFISTEGKGRITTDVAAMIIGAAIVYLIGVPWLKMVTGMPWTKALALGLYPFIPGDAIKIAAAIPVAKSLQRVIKARKEPTPRRKEASPFGA